MALLEWEKNLFLTLLQRIYSTRRVPCMFISVSTVALRRYVCVCVCVCKEDGFIYFYQ